MAIDVREGDILVSGATEYAIRVVDDWTLRTGGTALKRKATIAYSTKRNPALSGGNRGLPVTNLASVMGTPLDPLGSGELRQREELQSLYKPKQTFLYDGGTNYYHCIVEDIRV